MFNRFVSCVLLFVLLAVVAGWIHACSCCTVDTTCCTILIGLGRSIERDGGGVKIYRFRLESMGWINGEVLGRKSRQMSSVSTASGRQYVRIM